MFKDILWNMMRITFLYILYRKYKWRFNNGSIWGGSFPEYDTATEYFTYNFYHLQEQNNFQLFLQFFIVIEIKSPTDVLNLVKIHATFSFSFFLFLSVGFGGTLRNLWEVLHRLSSYFAFKAFVILSKIKTGKSTFEATWFISLYRRSK